MNNTNKNFEELKVKINNLLYIKRNEYEEKCSFLMENIKHKIEITKSNGDNYKRSVLLSSDEYKEYQEKENQVNVLEMLVKKLDMIFKTPCDVEKENTRIEETYKNLKNANQLYLKDKICNYLYEIDKINDTLKECYLIKYSDELINQWIDDTIILDKYLIIFDTDVLGESDKEETVLCSQRSYKYNELKKAEAKLYSLKIENRVDNKDEFDKVFQAFT